MRANEPGKDLGVKPPPRAGKQERPWETRGTRGPFVNLDARDAFQRRKAFLETFSVAVQEWVATSVQEGIEPRKAFPGAAVDVTGVDWKNRDSCGGGADRSAQVLTSNLTPLGRYLFTQTDPYPRAANLPELAFGAIIGTVA